MIHVDANGARIPALGFGTWMLSGADGVRAIERALEVGYRHLDTAQAYRNEAEVGEALRNSGVPRDEVFITTKIWPDHQAPGELQRAAEKSCETLKLDAVDLLLLHWPPKDLSLPAVLEALAEVKTSGRARHVGISNFTPPMIREAVSSSPVPLAVNQVEYHPYLDQSEVLKLCRDSGLGLTAYSPVAKGKVSEDAVMQRIGQAHGKTPGQVSLRWLVQQEGVIAIPRSSNHDRIKANFDIWDFELSAEEMKEISALARPDGRMVSPEGVAPDWNAA